MSNEQKQEKTPEEVLEVRDLEATDVKGGVVVAGDMEDTKFVQRYIIQHNE